MTLRREPSSFVTALQPPTSKTRHSNFNEAQYIVQKRHVHVRQTPHHELPAKNWDGFPAETKLLTRIRLYATKFVPCKYAIHYIYIASCVEATLGLFYIILKPERSSKPSNRSQTTNLGISLWSVCLYVCLSVYLPVSPTRWNGGMGFQGGHTRKV